MMNESIKIFNLEVLQYYLYLLKITWPALSGLFLICIFLGMRVVSSLKKSLSDPLNVRVKKNIFFQGLKILFTVAIVMIYFNMFTLSFGDWLQKPVTKQGEIKSIITESAFGQEEYRLILLSEEKIITLKIDKSISKRLYEHEIVEIIYLPINKEVVSCKILTRQA